MPLPILSLIPIAQQVISLFKNKDDKETTGQKVKKLITGLGNDDVNTVLGMVAKEDPEASEFFQDLITTANANQHELNVIDAKSKDRFRSYPRPMLMWICVIAVGYAFLVKPIFAPFVLKYAGVAMGTLNTVELMTLLGSLLGLGGMRSMDKMKGVHRK